MPIYKDCLGIPNSKATITVFGSNFGQTNTGYFALQTTSDYPNKNKRWEYISRDVSDIVAEMQNEGWQCVVEKDGYNAPVIKCAHVETQLYIDKITAESNNKFKNAEKGFVRFGECPKGGKSINYRDNIEEKGISVFEAEFAGNDYRLLLTDYLYVTYITVADRPVYRIYGDIVGTGADGEPVLKVINAVKL